FLDRKVEASLKRSGRCRTGSANGRFLDRKVEASLKPRGAAGAARRRHARFLDRKVEASLKPALNLDPHLRRSRIPRPKGRGLIEASSCLRAGLPRSRRFLDRKVEASLKLRSPVHRRVPRRGFLDRKVEASLKHALD